MLEHTMSTPFKTPRTARNVSQTDWREVDYGIDLLGTWSVPSALQPLKVLIQCKAFARKIEPSQARELEGAFVVLLLVGEKLECLVCWSHRIGHKRGKGCSGEE